MSGWTDNQEVEQLAALLKPPQELLALWPMDRWSATAATTAQNSSGRWKATNRSPPHRRGGRLNLCCSPPWVVQHRRGYACLAARIARGRTDASIE